MSATDNHGIAKNAGIVYYDPHSFFAQRGRAFWGELAKQDFRPPLPSILAREKQMTRSREP